MKTKKLPSAFTPANNRLRLYNLAQFNLSVKTLMLLLVAVMATLTSCEEDKPEPKPATTVTAKAGDDQTINLGTLVTLDASASTDSEGKTLTYSWAIVTKPATSNATLTNANQAKPTFTPDVAGEYELEVTVSNGTGSAKDKVKITVTAPTGNNVDLTKPIDADVVLANVVADPTKPDYRITTNLLVNAKLTIMPGVVIEADADKGIYINENGALIAKGTATNKIVFTGKDKTKGYWEGIMVISNNPANELDFVEVNYAGSSNLSGIGSAIKSGMVISYHGTIPGQMKITNTTFAHSNGYGLYLSGLGEVSNFANNTFSNNTGTAMYLKANLAHKLDAATKFKGGNGYEGVEIAGEVEQTNEVTWPAFTDGASYLVSEDVILESGVKIAAGAKIEFANETGFYVRDNGAYLIAKGTAANKIVFTGRNKVTGFWNGVMIVSSSPLNEMDYVEIAYAGKRNLSGIGSAIKSNLVLAGFNPGAKLKVTNSSFTHSGGYGMYVQESHAQLTGFANNTFSNNTGSALFVYAEQVHKLDAASKLKNSNGFDGVETSGELSLDNEVTWATFADGAGYYINGDLFFDSGVKVEATANAAPTFHFASDKALYVRENGHFIAKGTAAQKINFNGKAAQKGFWKGIMFASNSPLNEMSHVNVMNGGKTNLSGVNEKANISVRYDGALNIVNSKIGNSGGYGLYVRRNGVINNNAGTANTFENNTSTGYHKEQ
ncbi:MAG: PKD domain-containing protein [Adhaeribacter sp.]